MSTEKGNQPNQTTLSATEQATAQICGYISGFPLIGDSAIQESFMAPDEVLKQHGPKISAMINEAFPLPPQEAQDD